MSFDVKQAYREMKREQENIHIARARKNEAILRASGLPFLFEGIVKLRSQAFPAIDFDPGQQKWVVGDRVVLGDATALLAFLERRRKA